MEIEKIKLEMMDLWEKTFGDSQEYIKLVFDSYFKKEYIAYKIEDGKIVSALLAIPYNFMSADRCVKGLYLCGLATKIEYRGKGLMTELIEEINKRFEDSEFAFSFLIPASPSLVNYYLDNGYYGGIYRKKITILPDKNEVKLEDKNDKRENKKLYSSHLHLLKKNEFEEQLKVIDFIYEFESSQHNYLCLQHSKIDIRNIISEAFISDNRIYAIYDEKKQIKEIVFINIDEENKTCIIPKIYKKSNEISDDFITILRSYHPQYKIEIYFFEKDLKEDNEIQIQEIADFQSSCKISTNLYGMVRIINENEILKFAGRRSINSEFSILINHRHTRDFSLLRHEASKHECKNQERVFHKKIIKEKEPMLIRDSDISIEQNNSTRTVIPIPLPMSISLLLD